MSQNVTEVPAKPRRKRRFRLLFAIFALLVLLLVLLPSALSGLARTQLARRLTERLGTPCRIERLSVGWLSGIDFGPIEIANAPGFDPGHPLLRIDGGSGHVSLWSLFRGRFSVVANLRGPRLWIDEDEHGQTNLQRILAAAGIEAEFEVSGPPSDRTPTPGDPAAKPWQPPDAETTALLARFHVDIALRDGGLEIRRRGELIESMTGIDCSLLKELDSPRLRATFDATMPPTVAGALAGMVHVDGDFDALAGTGQATLRANRFDVARYQPLLTGVLAPGELTALAGVVDGSLTFRFDAAATPRGTASGELTVAGPRLQGALLQGMDLRAERWTFHPAFAVHPGADGVDAVSAAGTHVDFGFLRLDGLPGDRPDGAIAASFELDLPALARLGGPFAELPALGGRVAGTIALPRGVANAVTADAAVALLRDLRAITVEARLTDGQCAGGGFALTGGDLALTLRDGKLAIATAPTTLLNGGPLELRVGIDAAGDAASPVDLALTWRGGTVQGDAAWLLRYAAPVLAGLPKDAGAFASSIDAGLRLRGPSRAAAGESLLQWLDHFAGSGELELRDGSFAPTASLAGLCDLLGQPQRLAIDRLAGAFTMQQGTIATKAMRWVSKGQEYGLTGNVHLDGRLDFGLDVTSLLQQHKDGRVIAAALGGRPLLAGLTGTLDAPTFGAPDLGKFAADALKDAPRQLFEQQGQDLLKKGLEGLFGGKKK